MKAIIKTLLIALIISSCNMKTESNKKEAKQNNQNRTETNNQEPKVTGIGGIFFKSKNREAVINWYAKNLGIAVDGSGSAFEFRNANNPDEINYLRWGPFKDSTEYFDPSKKEFMINYRVQNIEGLVKKLKKNGVTIVDSITEYDYGKFVHIMDEEGTKIELWEPIDSFFTKMGGVTTK